MMVDFCPALSDRWLKSSSPPSAHALPASAHTAQKLSDSIIRYLIQNQCRCWYRIILLPLMMTEICGRLAEMIFYISAEEGGIREAEQVADLLDAIVGLLQVITDIL